MNELVKKEYEQYTSSELLSIIDTDQLKYPDIHSFLLDKIFIENSKSSLYRLFKKNIEIIPYINEEEKIQIINLYINEFKKIPLNHLIIYCRNTLFGNILFFSILLKNHPLITSDNINNFFDLFQLEYIDDDLLINNIPEDIKIRLQLNNIDNINIIKKSVELIPIIEKLFYYSFIIPDKNFITSIIYLYNNSDESLHRNKLEILNIILNGDIDLFLIKLNSLIDTELKTIMNVIDSYKEIYYFFYYRKIPIFFTFGNIVISEMITNNNAYYMLYIDKEGSRKLLPPFKSIQFDMVKKIFDLNTEIYKTPEFYSNEVIISNVYSFKELNKISEIQDKDIKLVKKMYEDEIIKKINNILEYDNPTSHGPTEILDIWTHKLLLMDENDFRLAGFIVKGRGYPKVSFDDIAVNLVKGTTQSNIDIIFLVFTGILDDMARKLFIDQSKMAKKMYCIVCKEDLTKIMLSYNVLY